MKVRITAIFLLLLALCVRMGSSQQLDVIRVAGPPSEPMKTVYYAERSGLFKKYGLDVQITLVNSGSAAMAAVAGGSVDLAHASVLSAIEAMRVAFASSSLRRPVCI